MRAKLTTIGLYNYDPTLFDLLTLPAGASKETAVNTILLEYGEMSVVYPDPSFYKFAIGQYSATMQEPMKRYWDVLHITYNPLENYDRQESFTESGTAARTRETEKEDGLTGTHGLTGTDARTTGGTDQQQGSRTETPNLTDNISNPPYNTETMTVRETQTHTGTVGTSDNYTTTSSGTDNLTLQRSDTTSQTATSTGTEEESETTSGTRSGRIHGNVGVTTSQQMLMAELEVAEQNFYRWLAADFAARFMVMLY